MSFASVAMALTAWETACELLHQMRLRRVFVTEIVQNLVMSTFSTCQGSSWIQALKLFEQSPATSLPPDVLGFNAAISACGTEWCLPFHLLRAMQDLQTRSPRSRVAPSLVSVSATVAACEKSAQWAAALDLLGILTSCRLRNASDPNGSGRGLSSASCTIPFNAAISACEKRALWRRGLLLLRPMCRENPVPNEITFNALIGACDRSIRETAEI